MFSDRDKEVGYEEEESVAVLLADKGSSCESDSVSIDENVVTITEEGTYILSGSLSDGMVIVDSEGAVTVSIPSPLRVRSDFENTAASILFSSIAIYVPKSASGLLMVLIRLYPEKMGYMEKIPRTVV